MSLSRHALLRALGVALLAAGLLVAFQVAPRRGGDFLSYYLMGQAVVDGTNVYDPVVRAEACARLGFVPPAGMYYPPATGFVLAPFALMPYHLAKHVWYALLILAVIFGVRALAKVAAPRAGPELWTIACGVILLSSAIRWGTFLSQGAPLVFGLLCFFIAALHSGRTWLAFALAALATAFKMTLALPFFGLLVLHRRYAMAAASVGAWAFANALGFLRFGPGSLAIYSENTAKLDALDNVANENMPDPFSGVSLPRLDFVYFFFGVTESLPLSRLLGLALCGAITLLLVWRGWREKPPISLEMTALFSAALICLGSLAVYHHQYDLCLFFVPLLLGFFLRDTLRPSRLVLALLLPITAMMLLLPIGKLQNLLVSVFGPVGGAFLKLSFPVAVTLALVASGLALARRASADW